MASINDLLNPAGLAQEDVLADEIGIAQALGIPDTAFASGRPLRSVMSLVASMVSKGYNTLALPALQGRFFQTAKGAWLTLLAWTDRDTQRAGAEFASGDTAVENRGGGFFTFAAGDLRIKNAAGQTFTNATSGTLLAWTGSGPYPQLNLTWTADQAGTGSNTPASGIQAYPTALVDGPANVYALTNASGWYGADEEADASVARRAVIAPSLASPNGPRDKYEAVAMGTTRADGTRVNVNRVRIIEPGNGVVQVVIASPAGAAAGDTSTPGSDVYLVNIQVQIIVAPGATATVASAVEHDVALGTIDLYVTAESNTTRAQAEAAAQAALVAWSQTVPISGRRTIPGGQGYVFVEEARALAKAAVPGCFKADCSASDTPLASNEVAVITWTVVGHVVTQG